jgi:hypothetical protein
MNGAEQHIHATTTGRSQRRDSWMVSARPAPYPLARFCSGWLCKLDRADNIGRPGCGSGTAVFYYRHCRGAVKGFAPAYLGPVRQSEEHAVSIDLTERLQACYTGVVHDVMRAMGLRDFTLPPELRPILPEQSLAGPAFTISGRVNADAVPTKRWCSGQGFCRKRNLATSGYPNPTTASSLTWVSSRPKR